MRGAPNLHIVRVYLTRIIPADAGSTFPFPPYHWLTGDHPRGCGEHLGSSGINLTLSGSSPRMRGAPTLWLALAVLVGIIPADAGSTHPR